MKTVYGEAVNNYLMSPQGQVDMWQMARDQVARVGPSIVRGEVRGSRYDDAESIRMQKDLDDALASEDNDRIQKAYARMGMAFQQQKQQEQQAPASDVEKKLDALVDALTKKGVI